MKNIITILIILFLPVSIYLIMNRNSSDNTVYAVDKNNPSVIIFTSTMCLDCQKMKNVVKEVEKDYSGKINFISVNALEKNKKVQDLVKKHSVVLVPTLIFTNENGQTINKIEGYIPKEEFINNIEEAING